VATLDTMLSFYLAFLYGGRKYYNVDRITCMSEFLFRVQERNRLQQKGLLKRFSINCYGKQDTKEEIRAEKSNVYKKLKDKRGSQEWDWYFLRYIPHEENEKKFKPKKSKSKKSKSKKSKSKKSKPKKSKRKKKATRKKKRSSNIFGI
jgi:hypothetical protein